MTPTDVLSFLTRQHEIAWALATYHLNGLETDECLWRPADCGLHIEQSGDGQWRGQWPEHEGYDLGPPSIAWLTWHMGFWWSMVLDHSFGNGTLDKERVVWPGSAEGVRSWLNELNHQWQTRLAELTDEDVQSSAKTRWPFQDRPFGDVVAWLNIELTKNAAELGYVRFLYARHNAVQHEGDLP